MTEGLHTLCADSPPRLCDLFCGGGGASRGYQLAGFAVTGVDIEPRASHVGTFVQEGALAYLERLLYRKSKGEPIPFDAFHASPPCQKFTAFSPLWERQKVYLDLLTPTRALLEQTGLPWVIENVPGAPMRPDAVLCGSHFGLAVRRHRWFETSWAETLFTLACDHSQETVCVVGHGGGSGKGTKVKRWTKADGEVAMGIDWMTRDELAQAVPPAYTEFIGEHLMGRVQLAKAAA